jgi:hypothetical protein
LSDLAEATPMTQHEPSASMLQLDLALAAAWIAPFAHVMAGWDRSKCEIRDYPKLSQRSRLMPRLTSSFRVAPRAGSHTIAVGCAQGY